jgi:hypothetical protein
MANKLLENPSAATLYMREWRAKNSDHSKEYKRQWDRKRRELVITHYGGECACCGEDEFGFLAIDHVNGGGTKHRAEIGSGSHMVTWLINENFPEGYRVLCHNCNQAIGFHGSCPHSKDE